MLPPDVVAEIEELMRSGWTGKYALNVHKGRIIEVEVLNRRRLGERNQVT